MFFSNGPAPGQNKNGPAPAQQKEHGPAPAQKFIISWLLCTAQ